MATATGEVVSILTMRVPIQPVATAGNSLTTIIGPVPGNAGDTYTVTGVSVVTVTAITGANTNTRSHNVTNRTSAGLGTTNVATLQYNSAINTVALAAKAITLNATAANLDVVVGDVLSFESTAVGTGIADPGGMAIVTLSRA